MPEVWRAALKQAKCPASIIRMHIRSHREFRIFARASSKGESIPVALCVPFFSFTDIIIPRTDVLVSCKRRSHRQSWLRITVAAALFKCFIAVMRQPGVGNKL